MDRQEKNQIIAEKVMGMRMIFDTWQDANGYDTGMAEYFKAAHNPYNPAENVAQAIEAIDEYCRKAAGMLGLSSEQRWRYIRCSPGARWWNKTVGGWRC